jgi:hypothetical protein
MQYATPLVVATFLAVYVGMALGRWPGLKIDRTGIAVLGRHRALLYGHCQQRDGAECNRLPDSTRL